MPTLKPLPPRAELIDRIRAAGSGDLKHFGYPVREDGLYLQQDPPEFADFVSYMATHASLRSCRSTSASRVVARRCS